MKAKIAHRFVLAAGKIRSAEQALDKQMFAELNITPSGSTAILQQPTSPKTLIPLGFIFNRVALQVVLSGSWKSLQQT